MQISEVRKIIYDELKKKKSITAQVLNYTPFNIPFIQSYGVLAHLVELGAVEKQDKTYTLIDEKKALGIFNEKASVKPEERKVKPLLIKSGRNTSKYVFEKIVYSKGACVHAVVKAYVRDNNPTYKELEKVFPPLVKRYGIINTLEKAKELSPDRPRYFMKDNQIIATKDKISVAVTNQWVHEIFLEFVDMINGVGYLITPE